MRVPCRSITRLFAALAVLAGANLVAHRAVAQDDPEIKDLHRRSMKFLGDISQKENVAGALQELLKGGPLEKSDAVQKLTPNVEQFDEVYGALLDQERISYKRVGKDLVLMKYLYKTERFPVVWRINFYRPPQGADTGWVVIGASFDTDLRKLDTVDR
ncbi:MAG: hypothetical protein QGG36_01720 [Pirellulaceae bacterium]|jgi:hypothetical protein|nr:hypothetical protein [Pirellulaceae bacterium]MDP7014496.1 hypothetical protein [Pirellulaceae bacterium]